MNCSGWGTQVIVTFVVEWLFQRLQSFNLLIPSLKDSRCANEHHSLEETTVITLEAFRQSENGIDTLSYCLPYCCRPPPQQRMKIILELEVFCVTNFIKGKLTMFLSDTKFLTYTEVAALLRCSEKTVFNRVKSGEIKPFYNGRKVLFTMECIEEFLTQASNQSDGLEIAKH